MTMKEFIDDFKAMLKTKNTDVFNQKYVQPTLEKSKEVAANTQEVVAKYTPIVVDAAKAGWDKANTVFQQKVKKTNEEDKVKADTTPTDTKSGDFSKNTSSTTSSNKTTSTTNDSFDSSDSSAKMNTRTQPKTPSTTSSQDSDIHQDPTEKL